MSTEHNHPATGAADSTKKEGHYNRITKQWETPTQYMVDSKQDGSTFPEQIGEPAGPTFKEQVAGQAKFFAGKVFGKEHEMAQGEALAKGQGADGAVKAGEEVKQSGGT